MSHIILEGVNRTGKSEMIKWFNEQGIFQDHKVFYDREVRNKYHKNKQAQAAMDAQLITMIRFLEITKEEFIFDRFHISEYVYSVLDRGYDCAKTMLDYDERLAGLDVKVIYMVDETTKIAERMPCPNNEAYFGNIDRARALKKHYNLFLNETKLPLMYFNYSSILDNNTFEIAELKDFLGINN